jgi:Na+:H+ antiporter, NhaA family
VSSPPLIQPIIEPFQRFIHTQSASGILLLTATITAMVWANSPWSETYEAFWTMPVSLMVGSHALTETLLEWINDGLMAMFFFVIGLEIKREVLVGELASFRQAALPLTAALGGAMLPAALYMTLNITGPGVPGWGIPMATDIAFALGILALLGNRVPLALKVFLTALAIADDLVAVLVIAVFYTSTISWVSLAIAGIFIALLFAANMAGIRHPLVYSILGIGGVWLAFLLSGVHATIAGVIAAMAIPSGTRLTGHEFISRGKELLERFEQAMSPVKPPLADHERHHITNRMKTAAQLAETPLQQFENTLHPWVTVVVMPIFALANAGITFDANIGTMLTSPVAMGIMIGLLVGKPVGIVFSSWIAIRVGFATWPSGVSWPHLWAVGCLAGIGFTMSLFITGLAFPHEQSSMSAKVGIILASTAAGTIGWLALKCIKQQ